MREYDIRRSAGPPSTGRGDAGILLLRKSRKAQAASVRGQALRSLLGAISARLTVEEVAAVLQLLPAEARIASQSLSGTAWYPVAWYAEIHRAVRAVTGAGPEICREIGREARRHDARGIYRFVLRFLSPESFFKHLDAVMALYAEGPRISARFVSDPGAREAKVSFRLDRAHGFDENVWADALGSMESLLELSGAMNPEVRATGGGDLNSWITAEASWLR